MNEKKLIACIYALAAFILLDVALAVALVYSALSLQRITETCAKIQQENAQLSEVVYDNFVTYGAEGENE